MSTQYKHRVTIVVPEALITKANHLACLMGESAEDVNTFNQATWRDTSGSLYAVASTVVKPVFLESATGTLPETPGHARVADRELAQQALDTLGKPGGIQMLVDVPPLEALEAMGLSPVEQEEPTDEEL